MNTIKIRYRSTDQHSNADAMSRLPLPDVLSETAQPAETILAIENIDKSPVSSSHIKTWTNHNLLLSWVLYHLQEGCPRSCSDPELLPFFKKRCELSLLDGCLLWGGRIVVPKPGRELLLQELHCGHPGMFRMKTLAQMFLWWPGLDSDIENIVQCCTNCHLQCPSPTRAPLHPWQ